MHSLLSTKQFNNELVSKLFKLLLGSLQEFRELSNFEWKVIDSLLLPRPRADNRMVLNGILPVLVTGCRWMDMPIKYGSYKTAQSRLKRRKTEEVWDRILERQHLIESMRQLLQIAQQLKPRRGLVGYDGFKHRKGSKIHLGVDESSIPLNFMMNSRNSRKQRPYNVELYRKMRSTVERSSGWIKNFRRIVIRYEKPVSTYKALTTITSVIIYLRCRIQRRVL